MFVIDGETWLVTRDQLTRRGFYGGNKVVARNVNIPSPSTEGKDRGLVGEIKRIVAEVDDSRSGRKQHSSRAGQCRHIKDVVLCSQVSRSGDIPDVRRARDIKSRVMTS